MAVRALVTGATGFVGRRLAKSLLRSGTDVRCLVRNPVTAADLARSGAELHRGDVTDESSLTGLGVDIDVAYYLVHSMADGPGFRERELAGAVNFARMATREGVSRVVYLGGLGEKPSSAHLRSRHETALALAAEGPPLTYFRAGMIVGSGSESYRTLRYLVKRLPVMVVPRWLRTVTQPIGIDDTISYLASAPGVPRSAGREVQIGGPDILSYAAMLDRMAFAMNVRPRPKLPVPFITPWLSSLWLGIVTPVDTNVARPLVEGLTTETIVTDQSEARLFAVEPLRFDETLRIALAEERGSRIEASIGGQPRRVDMPVLGHAQGDTTRAARPVSCAKDQRPGARESRAAE